jgi:ribosome-binding protein aMBF1 (putative translation factor)
MPKKQQVMPIVKSSRSLPKGSGWTGADIERQVDEIFFADSVGEALQTARKERQLTGSQLGKRMGVGRSRVSQLESKDTEYALQTLHRMLDALGYDLVLKLVPREGGKVILVSSRS